MKQFTESLGFVIFFLVGTLLVQTIFGDEVTFWYLLLVLLGMVLTNADKFEDLVGRYSKL